MRMTGKKLLALLLVVAVPLFCVACGEDNSAGAPALATEPAEVAARVTAEDAIRLVQSGQAVLVDTRSAGQYAEHHAEGAVLAPLQEIGENPYLPAITGIPEDQTMILYCT